MYRSLFARTLKIKVLAAEVVPALVYQWMMLLQLKMPTVLEH
jgi:hypothetical protein